MGSDPGKVPGNQEILGFLVRAPIDHFLRGKCDKCPPRVRRVKSGNPKNGHASGTFLDIFGLAAPLFWPILSIKGRTEPLKIQDFRVFFTFFHFFSLFRPKSDPKQGQNGSDLGNPGKSWKSWDFLGFLGFPARSWDFRVWHGLFRFCVIVVRVLAFHVCGVVAFSLPDRGLVPQEHDVGTVMRL